MIDASCSYCLATHFFCLHISRGWAGFQHFIIFITFFYHLIGFILTSLQPCCKMLHQVTPIIISKAIYNSTSSPASFATKYTTSISPLIPTRHGIAQRAVPTLPRPTHGANKSFSQLHFSSFKRIIQVKPIQVDHQSSLPRPPVTTSLNL